MQNLSQYITCPECGATLPVKRSGRKPLNIPVIKICDALQVYSSVEVAAKELDCSRGYIFKVLKASSLTLQEVRNSRKLNKRQGKK